MLDAGAVKFRVVAPTNPMVSLPTPKVVIVGPHGAGGASLSGLPVSQAALEARVLELEAEVRNLRSRLADSLRPHDAGDARFRETFERAAVGVAHVGLDGRFLTVNRRLCEILGYSEVELLNRTFQEITHPEDLAPDLALLSRLMNGELDRFEMEKRYLRPTGEIVWADLTVSLARDEAGQPRNFISVISDIGVRKQNEERLRFLMGELAHRSKNLLAVVQSAVRRIGAEARTVGEFQAAVDDRIVGIAASQDLILKHDHASVPVAELVVGQLSTFVRHPDPRLSVDGPDLELGVAATHSLGLALHELATNACKYGALSSGEGRLEVEWRTVGDEAGRFLMFWTERGGPPVTAPSRKGFGRRVIEEMIAQSLGGQVDLCFEPEGLTWRLEAPLRNLLR